MRVSLELVLNRKVKRRELVDVLVAEEPRLLPRGERTLSVVHYGCFLYSLNCLAVSVSFARALSEDLLCSLAFSILAHCLLSEICYQLIQSALISNSGRSSGSQ